MKRGLLVIIGVILLMVIAVAWWFLRDTPEKALRDGLNNLLTAKSAEQAALEIAWTNPETRVTTGVNFVGQVDAGDLTRPQFLGVLELGDGVAAGAQIADLVLIPDKLALRPRRVTSDYWSQYQTWSGDAKNKNFIFFDRDKLLLDRELNRFMAQGPPQDIRAQAAAFYGAVKISGEWKKQRAVYFGLRKVSARLASVPFQINESAMRSALASFLNVWHDAALTPGDLQWINRSSRGLARGLFRLTLDQDSRLPVSLEGGWPVLDDQDREILRVRVKLTLDGLNRSVSISLPENAKDATKSILKQSALGATLPSSPARAGSQTTTGAETPFRIPAAPESSIIFDTSTREYIDVENIDLWHKYMEELKKKKSQ